MSDHEQASKQASSAAHRTHQAVQCVYGVYKLSSFRVCNGVAYDINDIHFPWAQNETSHHSVTCSMCLYLPYCPVPIYTHTHTYVHTHSYTPGMGIFMTIPWLFISGNIFCKLYSMQTIILKYDGVYCTIPVRGSRCFWRLGHTILKLE